MRAVKIEKFYHKIIICQAPRNRKKALNLFSSVNRPQIPFMSVSGSMVFG